VINKYEITERVRGVLFREMDKTKLGNKHKEGFMKAIREVEKAGHEVDFKSLTGGRQSWYTLRSFVTGCNRCGARLRLENTGEIFIVIGGIKTEPIKCVEVDIKWIIE